MIPFRLMGPLARYTGYAVGFRGLVDRLLKSPEVDFQLRAARGKIPPETEDYLLQLIAKNGFYDRLGVVVGYPDMAEHICTRYHSLYTMYEADDIPEIWKPYVSRADEVWVPSQFCREVFGKYNPRVRVCPWGVDETLYKPRKRKKREGFVFGAVGVQSPRKGTDVLVSAFTTAFGERDGVRLIIKTRDTKKMPAINNRQVTVIDDDWPESRLVEFYHEIDCLVEPSRGEGVGMPPLQAALSGVPALVTNWGGPVDYIDDKGIWGIRIRGLSQAKNINAEDARWAEPDPLHLAELMQWVYETRPKVKGDYRQWTLGNMAASFLGCVRDAATRVR